ncbi:ATP-binding cassette domain-containing protein [Mastigocladopsis repens]|uniref:ATP-binding cassette domain-containing protein n=1 Tax=Mastigocladopsis repens TaxID=221287 RepID=UPI0002DD0A03|nr:ATP-binding cassette domain-containing protein [Mastigocladopsis repens]
MNPPTPIFELKNVTKQFGTFQSLTDINLQIYPGERVALVGSSGAGKSTLISLLNGTLQPTKGEVWVLLIATWHVYVLEDVCKVSIPTSPGDCKSRLYRQNPPTRV